MLKQDGNVEVGYDGKLKEVLDLMKIDDIRHIEGIQEFNKEKHEKTHRVDF